jgi:hypothetical protein
MNLASIHSGQAKERRRRRKKKGGGSWGAEQRTEQIRGRG